VDSVHAGVKLEDLQENVWRQCRTVALREIPHEEILDVDSKCSFYLRNDVT
jgi:hypothetical protein